MDERLNGIAGVACGLIFSRCWSNTLKKLFIDDVIPYSSPDEDGVKKKTYKLPCRNKSTFLANKALVKQYGSIRGNELIQERNRERANEYFEAMRRGR